MGYNKILFVLLGLLLLGSGLVMAISNATATKDSDLARWLGTNTAGNVTTEGGNISIVNVSADTLTDKWAGFFGQVTGNIYLTDNTNGISKYLFMWNSDNPTSGYVCVSTNSNYNFNTAGALADAAGIDSVWSFGAAPDNATNTFNKSPCNVVFNTPYNNIANTIYAKNSGPTGDSSFITCAISNGAAKDNFAFCSGINNNGKNYAGADADYELIVPVEAGNYTETYYFYVEFQ